MTGLHSTTFVIGSKHDGSVTQLAARVDKDQIDTLGCL